LTKAERRSLGIAFVAGLVLLVSIVTVDNWAKAQAPTATVSVQDGVVLLGETVSLLVVLDQAPAGLSGFNLVVTLNDSSKAEVIDAEFPNFWPAAATIESQTQIRVTAADVFLAVESGAANVTLATIIVRGLTTGQTGVQVVNEGLDDDLGNPIDAQAVLGVLNILMCGDLTGDGSVNVFDAITMLLIVVGLYQPTSLQAIVADLNRDGNINVFDAITVLQIIVGATAATECGPL
jgi:hypothetical protein